MLDYCSDPETDKHDAVVCIGAFSAAADDGLADLEASIPALFDTCNYPTVFTGMTKKRPNDDELSGSLDWLIPVMENCTERIYIDRKTLPHAAICGRYR